jgi:hypothetical protein
MKGFKLKTTATMGWFIVQGAPRGQEGLASGQSLMRRAERP